MFSLLSGQPVLRNTHHWHFDLATPLGSRRNCFVLSGLVVSDFVIVCLIRLVFLLIVIVHFVVVVWKMMLLSGTLVPNLGPLEMLWKCLVVVIVAMVVELVVVVVVVSWVPDQAQLDVMVVVIVVVMEYVVVLVHSLTMTTMKSLRRTMMN